MGIDLSSNFKFLKPMSGEVPYWPFDQAADIATRARRLLTKSALNDDDVELMSEDIGSSIEFYFDVEKQEARKSENFDDGSYPDQENTSLFDALCDLFDRYGGVGVPREETHKEDYEYFATLALVLISDYFVLLKYQFSVSEGKRKERSENDYKPYEVLTMANKLLEATEAICHAEQLHLSELTEKQQKKYQDWQKTQRHNELQVKRHQKTREAQALVWEAFEKDTHRFDSAVDHAENIIKTLKLTGDFAFKQSTVVNWVRKRAQQLGIKFR